MVQVSNEMIGVTLTEANGLASLGRRLLVSVHDPQEAVLTDADEGGRPVTVSASTVRL